MDVIYVRNGMVSKVVATHQEVDYAPNENPQPEVLQEDVDYRVEYAAVRCEACQGVFLEYELRNCLPDGKLLCARCAEGGR